jgi:hypothetical protein
MGAPLGRLVAAQRTEQLADRSVPLDYLGRLLQAFDGKRAVPHPGEAPPQRGRAWSSR